MKRILKNAPFDMPATLQVVEGTHEWDGAYANWLAGKNPTSDARWREGVFLGEFICDVCKKNQFLGLKTICYG